MTRKQDLIKKLDKLKEKKRVIIEEHRETVAPINKKIHSVTQMLYRQD